MFKVFFIICLLTLGLSVFIGLLAVWVPSSWRSGHGDKLFFTSLILFGASLAAACIVRWLG